MKAKIRTTENVEYVLKDKDGHVKPLFQPNRFFRWLIKKGFIQSIGAPLRIFGHYADKMVISNLVTTAGVAGVAARINGVGSPAAFTYIAIGIGATAANAADTALESEITTYGGERGLATASLVTTETADDTAQLVYLFEFITGASFAITESGVLNASSGGTLLARQVFSAINVTPGDSLQITWRFDVNT